jgi:ribosomal protein L11 methyltransferase
MNGRPDSWPALRVSAPSGILAEIEDEILPMLDETRILGSSRETWFDPAYLKSHGEERAPASGGCLCVYVSREADAGLVLGDLKAALDRRFGARALEEQGIRIEPVSIPDEDWATLWKEFFRPSRVSRRLLVLPAWWDADSCGAGVPPALFSDDDAGRMPAPQSSAPSAPEIVLRINPGRAFGSGTHATTQLSLRLLDRFVERGQRVLDFGSGSGILAFAARALGAGRTVAIEVDEDCIENYTENAQINGMEGSIDCRIGSSERIAVGEEFDLIVCNALFDRVSAHFGALIEHLAPGGLFLYSGFLQSESETVSARIEGLGLVIEKRENLEEWQAVAARKRG